MHLSDCSCALVNISAQLQSLRCIIAPKLFLKIYFLYDFGAHKLVHSEPFLDYVYKI